MRSLILIIALGATALGAFAQGPSGSKEHRPRASTSFDGKVELSAELSGKFTAGHPITATVVVENKGADAVVYYIPLSGAPCAVAVHDSAGKPVPLTRAGALVFPTGTTTRGSFMTGRLKRGERLDEKVDVGRYFDLSLPGEYTISISRKVVVVPPGDTVRLEISKLAFTVKAPD